MRFRFQISDFEYRLFSVMVNISIWLADIFSISLFKILNIRIKNVRVLRTKIKITFRLTAYKNSDFNI